MTNDGASCVDFRSMEALWQQMGALLFRVDTRSWDVTFIGENARAIIGQEPGMPVRGSAFWREALHPDELQDVLDALRRAADEGRPTTLQHRLRIADRCPSWMRTSATPEHARSHVLLGAMLDITASRENERLWRELESWVVTLGETLPFDFWICDAAGRCVLQNPAAVRRWGNARGARMDLLDAPAGENDRWRRALARALSGESTSEEVSTDDGEATSHFVRVVSPVRDGDELRGALGVDIDVTDVKRAELRLRESLDELGRTQEALVRSRELARLGEMAAAIAHEVRNPLATIVNAVSVIRKVAPSSPSDQAEMLWKIMDEEIGRIEWLVSNLLNYAQPLSPRLARCEIAPLVELVLDDMLRTDARAATLAVHRALGPESSCVVVDSHLLQLALCNVIRNAIQAMEDGGDLWVTIEDEESDGERWVKIIVADNGHGIAPDHFLRAFDPFFTTRATGNGLGLAIVKRIIDAHGGTAEIATNAERGARFSIRLKAMDEASGS